MHDSTPAGRISASQMNTRCRWRATSRSSTSPNRVWRKEGQMHTGDRHGHSHRMTGQTNRAKHHIRTQATLAHAPRAFTCSVQ